MRTQLSRSQQALGRHGLAVSLAREASEGLRAASAQIPEARELWLNLGEALVWQGQLEPALAADLRAEARTAYDRAGVLSPLKAEHAVARATLG